MMDLVYSVLTHPVGTLILGVIFGCLSMALIMLEYRENN